MKKCPVCGKTYPDDDNFCNVCGVELVEEVQEVRTEPQTLVENVTPITPSVLKQFYKRSQIFGLVFTILGGVICTPWLLFSVFNPDAFDFPLAGVIVLVCGIVLLVIANNAVKNNKTVTEETVNVYHFSEKEIHTLEFRGKEKRGERKLDYQEIVAVRKVDEYYHIQFSGLIWLVRRDGFTVGTEAEFCKLLREKCQQGVVKFK